jgi:hypothetical protein
VLRLLDTSSGSYADIRPARPGLLRACAHVPGTADLTGLRVLLVADLLTRAAELRRLQVLTALTSEEETQAVERAAAALGIHPPAAHARPDQAEASLGGPVDVHLAPPGDDRHGGPVARVAPAQGPPAGQDPLALRLALLEIPWHQPADLTDKALAEAHETLAGWRRLVAEWANSPSKPVPAAAAATMKTAFAELDPAPVLALLRALAGDDEPPGAKFEIFVYADRVLALELPRDIGRFPLPSTGPRGARLDPRRGGLP